MASQNNSEPRCNLLWTPQDPIQQELSAILKPMKQDPLGVVSLGKDGILRSLTADRDVIDAAPLTSKHIAALHGRMPPGYINDAEWEGVDGTATPKEKWFNPDKGILPEPLSEEQKAKAKVRYEEHLALEKRQDKA
ncbi:hypothetical protein GGR57DRAFT_244905 [Xylariaceae sp. FL1272]|nr:hypothetical protein GGR57DRAFT_244905 [Xylariaceae sp. FL1272]